MREYVSSRPLAAVLSSLFLIGSVEAVSFERVSEPRVFPAERYQTNGVEVAFLEGLPYKGRSTKVFCYYGVPEHKAGEKVPGMVLVHGGLGSAFYRWVRFWNARGYAAIALDTCGCISGNTIGDEQRGHFRHADAGPAGWGGFDQLDEKVEDQWLYHAVGDVMIAHSFLRTREGVDAARIGLTGVSWGAVISSIVASVDDRFAFAAPVYGCGAFLENSPMWTSAVRQMGAEKVARWNALWDPVHYLAQAKMPVCWLAGTNDSAFSLPALMRSFAVVPTEKALALRVRLPHGHEKVSEESVDVTSWADHYLKGVEPGPVVRAELNFTRSRVAAWIDRVWETVPAKLEKERPVADLPKEATAFYYNLYRADGSVMSTSVRLVSNQTDRPSFGPLSPSAVPYERQYIWPEGKMPDVRPDQIAAKTDEARKPGFDRAANRRPFIEWYAPAASNKTDVCVMTVSGGGFDITCDAARLQPVIDRFVRAGITVADVTYRTPRPEGLPIHQSAWEDVQRAVRVVKSEAAKRGFSPEKVGATGISAGAKTVLLLAVRSQTRAYEPIDAIDEIPAHLAFALPQAPAYVLADGTTGPNAKKGVGAEIVPELTFDEKTCPMCFLQGADDVYSPLGSVRLYQRLTGLAQGVGHPLPVELHLFANRWHGFHGDATRGGQGTAWDHWCDRMLAFVGRLYPEVEAPRFVWSLPPQSEAELQGLEAALPGPIYLAGTEDPVRQARLVEDWTREWIKGAQSDLHLECVPMTTTEKASRIREYLNHCGL